MTSEDEKKSNKKWRRCPICWDAVYAKDLKNVRFWAVRSIKGVGDGGMIGGDEMITMRLIQRSVNSTLALPRSSTWPSRDESSALSSTPWHFSPDVLTFSKLMLASPGYMREEYNKDLKDLQDMLQEAKSFNSIEEIPFIEMAMVNIKEHLDVLQASSKIDVAEAEKRARELIAMSEKNSEEKNLQATQRNSSGDDEDFFKPEDTPPSFLPDEFREQPHIANIYLHSKSEQKSKAKSVQSNVSNDGFYHFYQSEDGQHIYLHPLDIRVLKQEFGSYERFPNEITVKIIGVEETTITEELRKRCKYLGHLPLSCDVTFLEVDLKEIVSDLTLQGFSSTLFFRRNFTSVEIAGKKRLKKKNVCTKLLLKEKDGETEIDKKPPGVIMNGPNEDDLKNNKTSYSGPKTVWGTPVVSIATVTPPSSK
ncbi:7777_t:CDS:2, partial [Acaulospora colombiana]